MLCNNAGFGGGMAPLHKQSLELWNKVHDTNIKGSFLGMKYGIEAMLRTGGGAIVNTGSASAVIGWKHHSVYAAAKATPPPPSPAWCCRSTAVIRSASRAWAPNAPA